MRISICSLALSLALIGCAEEPPPVTTTTTVTREVTTTGPATGEVVVTQAPLLLGSKPKQSRLDLIMPGAPAIGDGRGQVMFGCPAVGLYDRDQQQYGWKATGCDAPEAGFGSRAIGGNPPPDRAQGWDSLRFSENDELSCIVSSLRFRGFRVRMMHTRACVAAGKTWFPGLAVRFPGWSRLLNS